MGRKQYRRRTILAGLAVGLAGCSGQATDRTTSSPRTATATGTTTTSRTTTDAPEDASTTEEPVAVREWPDAYYQGPMVSAHEHMIGPDGYSVARDDLTGFVEWMDRNRVAQVMAIAGDPHMDAVADHDDRLVPFAFGYSSLRNHFDDLAGAFRERFAQYPAYDGIGEISLQGQLMTAGEPPTPVDHPELMAVYEFATEKDVPVMLHTVAPWRYQGGDGEWETPGEYPPFQQLDRAMAAHRETDFLVHASYQWNGMPDGELVAEKLA